ncbi:hypothetical protein C8A00DRAFT_29293 [Chaetomidium leptoderma]|uniref:DUF7732 domain-containing protein n=1 Tax=Chaetomidium leptoderma TaxID=669021 RepID=A0AAN6VX56_9PEZI|nr:hypothetical protein C8A00DRAFT_29293 [Chaetomidium leptoderma]
MRFSSVFCAAALFGDVAVNALVAPPSAEVSIYQPAQNTERDESSSKELWKRKGGGGGGGRGGGGGSRGGGGSSSSSGSSGPSGGRGSPSSNIGGTTTTGSGPRAAYGGGRYYGGGAATPYQSGQRSRSGIAPVFLGVGLLAFWPGLWLYGAHLYPYHNPYRFYNASSEKNETKPVTCACDPRNTCGCDENGDQQYMNDLIGNGSYEGLNKTLVNVADVNGTSTILVNGTLPNGTTAAGGTENPNAADGLSALLRHAGWWPVAAAVCAIVFTV